MVFRQEGSQRYRFDRYRKSGADYGVTKFTYGARVVVLAIPIIIMVIMLRRAYGITSWWRKNCG